MNVSTNPGMMIEWHQYGRHDYHSQELGHITHFLAKGCGSCRPREAYSDLFYGSTAPVGLGFLIVEISRSHSDTPQSEDSSGRVNGPSRRPLLDSTQHSQTSMPPGEIRTHNPSKRAAADPRLRPHGHRGQLCL